MTSPRLSHYITTSGEASLFSNTGASRCVIKEWMRSMRTSERTDSMIAMWAIRLACLGVAGLCGVVLSPTTALAQQDPVLKEKLASAIEDYDILELDAAEGTLRDALEHAESNGLRGPVVAQLHVMLGIVLFANGDEGATKKAFIAAVESSPEAQVPPVYETPELSSIMSQARAEAKPAKANNNNVNSGVGAGGDDFEHKPVTRADAGKPLAFQVFVPESMPVFRVMLHHRRFGEDTFSEAEMKPSSATIFSVTLPGEQVSTSQIDYYIQALDRGGAAIAQSGSDTSPLTAVVISGEGDVKVTPPDGDPPDVEEPDGPVREETKHVYVMLGGGSGAGFLPGGRPTANPDRSVAAGVAPAFGHALLDAGWIINASMRLGLYFRWQFSPPQDFNLVPEESKGGSFPSTRDECLGFGLPGDCLLGLRYRYYLSGPDPDRVRFYSSVGLGVGRVRNWLKIKEFAELQDGQDNPKCVGKDQFKSQDASQGNFCYLRDTVRPGWGHFGIGAGLSVPLAQMVEFTADTYLMFLTLDQTSINADLNLGFVFKF